MLFSSLRATITMENSGLFFASIKNFIVKFNLALFIIIFFLLRLPSVYLLPIKSVLFTSHTIASILILMLIPSILELFSTKRRIELCDLLILFFFVSQTLSAIPATNIREFILVYKNVVLGISIYFYTCVFNKNKEFVPLVIKTIIITMILNLIYQAIFYFRIPLLKAGLDEWLYTKFSYFINLQASRNRYFIEIYDWPLIAIIALSIKNSKSILNKILLYCLALALLVFSNLSNYRIIFLVTITALVCSLIINHREALRKHLLKLLIWTFLILGMLALSNRLSIDNYQQSAVSRLIMNNEEGITTIKSRFNLWSIGYEMGLSSPYFGVGLGNYYDSLVNKQTIVNSLFNWKNSLMRVTSINPHNIFVNQFAETGFLGLFSYLLLLSAFVYNDLVRWVKKPDVDKILIVSFWSLFAISLFGPTFDLQYQFLFWLLRGLINNQVV